jgi:hypothetical protein
MQAFHGNKMNWVRGVAIEKGGHGSQQIHSILMKIGVILAEHYNKASYYLMQAFRRWHRFVVDLQDKDAIEIVTMKQRMSEALTVLIHCCRHGRTQRVSQVCSTGVCSRSAAFDSLVLFCSCSLHAFVVG